MDQIRKMVVCMICFVVMATVICIRINADGEPAEIVTNAKAAVLTDIESGRVVYSKNPARKLPIASTTKIMTTILTIEAGNLDSRFTVDSGAIRVEGSSMGLLEGDCVTRRDLCYGMLLPSGNDAANAAAVSVSGSIEDFVDLMNKKAAELGLKNTHFVTPSGLDDFTDDHYSTAEDMCRLAAYALKNETFREICATKSTSLDLGGRTLWLKNTNRLLDECEGVFGVKTGFTDKAGRCLVSACEREGITLVCVTLGDSTDWIDHEKLFDKGYERLDRVTLGGESYSLPYAGGSKDCAELISDKITVTLDKDEAERLGERISLPIFVYEDERGKAVGNVVYTLDGGVVAVCDIFLN